MSDEAEEIRAKIANLVSDSQLAINRGARDGVVDGATARLYRSVEIKDPDTGEQLGIVRVPRLNFRVNLLSDKYCLASVTDREEGGRSTVGGAGAQIVFARGPLKKITDDPSDEPRKYFVAAGDEISIFNPKSEQEPPF